MKKTFILPALFSALLFTSAYGQTADTARMAKELKQLNYLREDWANLKRFEKENAAVQPPAKGEDRVVFMGNSITQGWSDKDPEFFKGKPYINRGIGGQTTPQMLLRFRPDVINLKPKVVVILAGTNDIAGNTGPTSEETIVGNIQSMALLAQHYGIKVVLSSILPVYDYPWRRGLNPVPKIASVNKSLKEFAAANKMVYLDYFTPMVDEQQGLKKELTYDGVHPNEAGYKVMEPLAEAAIKAALKKK
ncbi:SGNH/GDSL hydrolase family protein [Mucilaginibacter sp. UR6-1]|uniref:SGNH/GDSL hydrolase family protein n=1 Tax=Mucilaginibacter sp. UR6-1 TaxID=1435643 RepID=UPI001E4FAE00|nr:SGNH/GDSL hydrolase family protein [Mucilaginibacter sp. UR6-1]MCC8407547.1 SGNH/GDSL hydrolase family protein [Mucilaginibacter sp. UR6-1]